MANNNAAVVPTIDPLAPFPRRSVKHEWIETTLTSLEEQINAAAANNNINNNTLNNPAASSAHHGSAPAASTRGGGDKNKPGTANSQQGKGRAGRGDSINGGLQPLDASGQQTLQPQLSPEQLAYAAYQPIRRHVTNAALVSLFSDKRLLMMGGCSGGESVSQVAEFDVATKQWSHGLPLPDKLSETTAAVCYVAPPPQPTRAVSADGGGAGAASGTSSFEDNDVFSSTMGGGLGGGGGGGRGNKSINPSGKKDAAAPQLGADAVAALAASTPQQLIVLFGGWNDRSVLNETLFYLVSGVCPQSPEQKVQGKWWRLPAAAQRPTPRRGHSMTSIVDASSVIQQSLPSNAAVAGGALQPGTATAYTTYSQIRYNTSIYVFGGFDGTRRLNDLWLLDVPFNTCCPASPTPATNVAADNMSWKRVSNATGFIPTPRDGASLATDAANRRLFLFGGFSTHRENDCYSFDIDSSVWTKLSLAPSPPCRFGSLAAINGNFAILGLGQDAKGPSNAMFQLLLPPGGGGGNNNNSNNNNNASLTGASMTGGGGDDNSFMMDHNNNNNTNQQDSNSYYSAKWSLCPLENSALVDAKQTKSGGGGGKGNSKDDDLANQTPELDPEHRLDFCFCVTPELGPVLQQLAAIPDQAAGGSNTKGGGGGSKAPDSGRGGGNSGGSGGVDSSSLHQKRTVWVFGGTNDKSQYSTSLLEIEMDRVEVQVNAKGKK